MADPFNISWKLNIQLFPCTVSNASSHRNFLVNTFMCPFRVDLKIISSAMQGLGIRDAASNWNQYVMDHVRISDV